MVDPVTSTIIAMWAGGATSGQIAKTIGYGRNAVTSLINNLIRSGEISKLTKQARVDAINARIQELGKVRGKANFDAGFKAKNIRLSQLAHDSCRFIVEGQSKKTMYCGHVKFKYSYCEHHYKLCYIPRPSKEKIDDAT
jgi:hypothetical protein